ncbi:MAG: DUF3568 family protein [Verrucomicrobia bacterium]|nr:DUF3568 family protein [Verrucomicrobiota bacterium]
MKIWSRECFKSRFAKVAQTSSLPLLGNFTANLEAGKMPALLLERTLRGIFCVACCALLSGCAALLIGTGAAVGAGSVVYVNGGLRTTETVSLDTAWTAAQTGMKDLELAVVSREKDALRAHLKARGAGDRKISLKLKNKGEETTELRIRVGLFGDKSLSQAILDAVRKHYGTPPKTKR